MELEGFGVSLVGRNLWVVGSQIPWEYIQGTHYAARILICGNRPTLAELEGDWNSIWCNPQIKDWSFIATILRGIGLANCLLVMEHILPPPSFWHFLETMTRGVMTKVWIHNEAPEFVPDAVFFPPLKGILAEQALDIFHTLPPRNGHGGWVANSWDSIVAATAAQDLGVVVSDVEETTWTLMWHRPDDSRLPKEKSASIAKRWIQLATDLL